ncbi:transposase [Streptomyces sp. NPDC058107]|uniref:transposase n=1 Tax=Streptomyces sp. NPDC058107 TaxID=3346343 RepID=UPI0036EFE5D3
MAQKRRKFSPEFRDEAVKMVVVESRPIAEVARVAYFIPIVAVNTRLGNFVASFAHWD